MLYNFKLYDNFLTAAKECGIEVTSQDGSVIYLVLPNDLNKKFWCMLWTPLNKLGLVLETDSWTRRLDTLKSNHEDFHLEFCPKETAMGSYAFFPEINCKANKDITKDDIIQAIKKILDEDNHHKHTLMALLAEDLE